MTILAYDLGAGSGRAIIGRLSDNRIVTQEIHRFSNDPVKVGDRLYWDILRLYHEIQQGLVIAKQERMLPESIGIDSWAVDFGLIGRTGELLANPSHYRDWHTHGVMEQMQNELGTEQIFESTGIQFLGFNTLYQLAAMRRNGSPVLKEAERFLMIPDLLRYFMTGEMINEFTNATTTQMYNSRQQDWDRKLLSHIGIPSSWFGRPVQPGAPAGHLRSSLMVDLGLPAIPVTAVAEHDTASAVVAVPALSDSFAYLSCGTWSLMGTEVSEPVITEQARELNFTNEGGAYGTYRLLKNIMGLWIFQEYKRECERDGHHASYSEWIQHTAGSAPFLSFIDPDDTLFLHAGDMRSRVRQYCRQTGQQLPDTYGAVARCIFESLVLKYRYVLEQTEQLSGKRFDGLHMVGGGIQNRLLCQWTANALGRPVWAGPAEGSAIGNLAVQWIAQGTFSDIREARAVIRDSFPMDIYEPQESEAWEDAYGRFLRLTAIPVQ
ncbi:rhamnulokinase [Paenibacillus bovis]|uniref:Carbohydrate kinase n=1 Tax=Paenibacillus bovis TaxID=1616788 RepID=A0A172ZGG9_9BACL|nr:rhamnulokinase family protein [Paenibacillus bovis]ANF96745.1 carbohydrate kinase [Paenibacillus bovis]